MRQVYLIYRPELTEFVSPDVDLTTHWPCVATLVWETARPGYTCAGGVLHSYDACRRSLERGPHRMLDPVLEWDNEVWIAVNVGDVGMDENLRQIMQRVEAVQPPTLWPVRPRK